MRRGQRLLAARVRQAKPREAAAPRRQGTPPDIGREVSPTSHEVAGCTPDKEASRDQPGAASLCAGRGSSWSPRQVRRFLPDATVRTWRRSSGRPVRHPSNRCCSGSVQVTLLRLEHRCEIRPRERAVDNHAFLRQAPTRPALCCRRPPVSANGWAASNRPTKSPSRCVAILVLLQQHTEPISFGGGGTSPIRASATGGTRDISSFDLLSGLHDPSFLRSLSA